MCWMISVKWCSRVQFQVLVKIKTQFYFLFVFVEFKVHFINHMENFLIENSLQNISTFLQVSLRSKSQQEVSKEKCVSTKHVKMKVMTSSYWQFTWLLLNQKSEVECEPSQFCFNDFWLFPEIICSSFKYKTV